VLEGAGAAGVAAVLFGKIPQRFKKVAVMACGSNIDMNMLSRLLERDMAQQGRLLRLKVSMPDRPGSLQRATTILAAEGANVLEVIHDRSFSEVPINVDISFVLEVRDNRHRKQIIEALSSSGLTIVLQE
jgi:threonine dehydratase